MKGLLGRLCGSKRSDLATPHSPLRGAGRKQVGDFGDGNSAETSHVRFQDSDLGKITNYRHSHFTTTLFPVSVIVTKCRR